MTSRLERSEPEVTALNRSHPLPTGTWTIDPADSSVLFAWRTLRLWTSTSRLHGLGVIHLDALPPVGVIRFQQPSGLPVLTMALDPASVETQDADLHPLGGGPDVVGRRWWTLRSESLQIVPTGAWRVMATLTARGTAGLVELRLEVDPNASRRDRLVLDGRGVLDRRAFGLGRRAWSFGPRIQLELDLHATRAGSAQRSPATTRPRQPDLGGRRRRPGRSLDTEAFDQGLAESLADGRFRIAIVLDAAPAELVRLVGAPDRPGHRVCLRRQRLSHPGAPAGRTRAMAT